MQHKEEDIEFLLWQYIDDQCNADEKAHVLHMLATNLIWKNKLEELQALHNVIAKQALPIQPSDVFTRQVMDKITAAPTAKRYFNPYIIRGIASFFIIVLTSLLIYAVCITDWHFIPHTNNFHTTKLITTDFINIMSFIAVIIGLLFVDTLFRRRKIAIR